jgi:putative glutamine amidotransferase
MTKPLKIAFSRCSGTPKYELYTHWIRHVAPDAECIDLFTLAPDSACKLLSACDALILTGGPDVHPARFGKQGNEDRCSIDEDRDTLEFALIQKAAALNMPVLGICRGMQILNVAHGGSLIIDIPADAATQIIHRCEEGDCMHRISVDTTSALYHCTKQGCGTVNSFHHQAVDRVADCFVISARSDDKLPEALEWKDPAGKPFLLAVQWHPERLDFDDPFAKVPAEALIRAAENYSKR